MSLEFDGSSQKIEDTDGENYINGLTAITGSIWVKSDVTNTDKGFVFGLPTPDGTDQYIAMRYDAAGFAGGGSNLIKIGLTLTGPVQHNVETTSGTQTTNWQHIVFKWSSGNNIRVFLDGVEDTGLTVTGSNTGSITNCTTLNIGQGAKGSSSTGWDGLVDDFRLYNRALSDNELITLYNARGADRILNGLLVRYCFQEFASGTTLATTANAVKDWGNTAARHATRTGTTGPVYRESVLRLTGKHKR